MSADGVELYNEMTQLFSTINNWSEDEQDDFISLTSRFFETNRDFFQQYKKYFEDFLLDDLSLSVSNLKKAEQLLN